MIDIKKQYTIDGYPVKLVKPEGIVPSKNEDVSLVAIYTEQGCIRAIGFTAKGDARGIGYKSKRLVPVMVTINMWVNVYSSDTSQGVTSGGIYLTQTLARERCKGGRNYMGAFPIEIEVHKDA